MAPVRCTAPAEKANSDQTFDNKVRPSFHRTQPTSQVPRVSKPRSRKTETPFAIFADQHVSAFMLSTSLTTNPTPATSTPTRRIPLGLRKDLGNARRFGQPRGASDPFSFNTADPTWEDTENYVPSPLRSSPASPPAMPSSPAVPFSTAPPAWFANARIANARSAPAASANSFPTPQRTRQSQRPKRAPGPKSMVLYRLLDLKDWKVDDKAINAAYKRVAVKYHPDKVYAENREAANARMTKINAAKDVLVDDEARNK